MDQAVAVSNTQEDSSDTDLEPVDIFEGEKCVAKPSSSQFQAASLDLPKSPVANSLKTTNELLKSLKTISVNMEKKLNEHIRQVKEHNLSTQKALEDIYNELYVIKKCNLHRQKAEKIQNKFPDFPIKTIDDFKQLEIKLKNAGFGENLQKALSEHVMQLEPTTSSIKEHFRVMLGVIFSGELVKDLAWGEYPNKISLKSTKLMDLVQSEYIILVIMYYLIFI